MLKDKETIIEDLREDRDDWKQQAQRLLLKSPQSHREDDSKNLATTPPEDYKPMPLRQNFTDYAMYFLLIITLGGIVLIFWMENTKIENKNVLLESQKELTNQFNNNQNFQHTPLPKSLLPTNQSNHFSFQQ